MIFRCSSLVALLLLASAPAQAAVIQASSCSNTDVQNSINSAASGDTVNLPSGCSATWNSAVSLPGSKGITLQGNGANITRGSLSDGAGLITLSVNASTSSRITGFSFSDSKAVNF